MKNTGPQNPGVRPLAPIRGGTALGLQGRARESDVEAGQSRGPAARDLGGTVTAAAAGPALRRPRLLGRRGLSQRAAELGPGPSAAGSLAGSAVRARRQPEFAGRGRGAAEEPSQGCAGDRRRGHSGRRSALSLLCFQIRAAVTQAGALGRIPRRLPFASWGAGTPPPSAPAAREARPSAERPGGESVPGPRVLSLAGRLPER